MLPHGHCAKEPALAGSNIFSAICDDASGGPGSGRSNKRRGGTTRSKVFSGFVCAADALNFVEGNLRSFSPRPLPSPAPRVSLHRLFCALACRAHAFTRALRVCYILRGRVRKLYRFALPNDCSIVRARVRECHTRVARGFIVFQPPLPRAVESFLFLFMLRVAVLADC